MKLATSQKAPLTQWKDGTVSHCLVPRLAPQGKVCQTVDLVWASPRSPLCASS